jgi:hypothetical protein
VIAGKEERKQHTKHTNKITSTTTTMMTTSEDNASHEEKLFTEVLGLINCLILLVTARNREATYSQRKAGSKEAVRKTT